MTDNALPLGDGRPLHWASPLYELVFHLANMIPTMLGLGLAASSERFAIWGVAGMIVMGVATIIYSVFAARRIRYWITDEDLVIRSGIIGRTVRRIPWARVENVQQKRNVLHRLTGVAEVVVEAGGGMNAEAKLRVLSLAAAAEFEQAVREHKQGTAAPISQAETAALLTLDSPELVRAGLISNQGWLAVGAMFALVYQFDDYFPVGQWMKDAGSATVSAVGLDHGVVFWISLLIVLALVGFALMRVLSITWWLVRFHGFSLHLVDEKLSTEHGLFTKRRGASHRQRVQRLLVLDGWLYRLFKRQAIQVGVAGQREALNETDSLRWLAPVVRAERRSELLNVALPILDERSLDWRPLHNSAGWRVWFSHAIFVPLLLLLLVVSPSLVAVLVVAALVLITLDAFAYARFAGYAIDDRIVAFREGFLDRQTWFVPIDRIEWVALITSPMDRANGTASVSIELRTRGPGGRAQIPMLALADAEALASRLRQQLALLAD